MKFTSENVLLKAEFPKIKGHIVTISKSLLCEPPRKLTSRERRHWDIYIRSVPIVAGPHPEYATLLIGLVIHTIAAEDCDTVIATSRSLIEIAEAKRERRQETRFILALMRSLRLTLSSQRSDKQALAAARKRGKHWTPQTAEEIRAAVLAHAARKEQE